MKGKKIKTLTSEFWLSNWKPLHAAFPPLLWPLENRDGRQTGLRAMPTLLLYLLPLSSQIVRDESSTRIRAGNPSMTNTCNIQCMQASSTAFLTKHKGKKKKKTTKTLSHSVIRTPHGLAFSYKLVRSKADWERWMESFGTEITRAELSFPPPYFPSCGNSNSSTYIKGTDLTCQVCLGHWKRRSPFCPKPFWTAWVIIYTEPSTDTELKTVSISLWHTSLADNPVQ